MGCLPRFRLHLIDLFKQGRRISPVLMLLFLLIISLVLFNAIIHHPFIGQNAENHLNYLQAGRCLQLQKEI